MCIGLKQENEAGTETIPNKRENKVRNIERNGGSAFVSGWSRYLYMDKM